MATQTTTTMHAGKQSRLAAVFAEFWPDEESSSSMTPPVLKRVVSPAPHQLSLAAKMSDLLVHQSSPPASPCTSPNFHPRTRRIIRPVISSPTATMPGTFPNSLRSPTPPSTSRGSTNSFQTATSHQVTTNVEWTSFSVQDAQILQSRLDSSKNQGRWSYDEANLRPPSPSRDISSSSSDEVTPGAKVFLKVGAQVKQPWSYDRANRAVQEQLQYATSLGITVNTIQDMYESPEEQTTPETESTVTKKRLSPNAKEFVPSSAVSPALKWAMLSAKEFIPQAHEQVGQQLESLLEQQQPFETWEAFQRWQAWVAEQGCYGQNQDVGVGYADTVAVEDSVSCVGGGPELVTTGRRQRASSLEEMYVGGWVFPEGEVGEPVWVEQRYGGFHEQYQAVAQEGQQTLKEEPYEVKIERWLDMGDDEFWLA